MSITPRPSCWWSSLHPRSLSPRPNALVCSASPASRATPLRIPVDQKNRHPPSKAETSCCLGQWLSSTDAVSSSLLYSGH